MQHFIRLSLLAFLLALALPQGADARAGGGGSFGSRGTRTYQSSPYSAQPLSRSTAARPSSAPSRPYASPVSPMPYNGGGRSFLSSMAGGFLGAGLFHMFFGGGGGGYGGGVGGSGIGFFELLVLGGVGYYLYKRFRGAGYPSANTFAPAVGSYAGNAPYAGSAMSAMPVGYNSQAPESAQPLNVTDTDKKDFEQLLQHIQTAWSAGDLSRMRQYATPEMVQYFSEELSADASRGQANKVEQVALESADIVESWSEFNLDYATAGMRWSSLDYKVRLDRAPGDADYIASGDNHRPVQAEEYWTFARSSGGHWLLSAIQQL